MIFGSRILRWKTIKKMSRSKAFRWRCKRHEKIIRGQRSDEIKLSLHDARLKGIVLKKDRAEFDFEYIFDYSGPQVQAAKARISFLNLAPDDVTIYVLTENYKKRKIKGKTYDLKAFLKKYKKLDFEILSETYHGYDTVWEGLLYNTKKGLKRCIMTMWSQGDIVYYIGKPVVE